MCIDILVLWIWSFVRYFLGIVGILGFCDFFYSSQYDDTSILYSIFKIVKDSLSSVNVGMIGQTILKP